MSRKTAVAVGKDGCSVQPLFTNLMWYFCVCFRSMRDLYLFPRLVLVADCLDSLSSSTGFLFSLDFGGLLVFCKNVRFDKLCSKVWSCIFPYSPPFTFFFLARLVACSVALFFCMRFPALFFLLLVLAHFLPASCFPAFCSACNVLSS